MEEVIATFIFILGAVFGSFFNVCIYRLPLNKSIIYPRSFCPYCQTQIKFWQNIPILSYILLRGRCAYCQARISFRYPLVELLTASVYLVGWQFYGRSWELVVYLFFASMLIIITFIDLEHQLILNRLTYPMIILGLAVSLFKGVLIEAGLGLIVGGSIIYLLVKVSPYIFGKEGMGGGDIKLSAAIGSFLGWQGVILTLFLASLFGSLVGGALILFKKKKRGEYIAFGPYLCLGAFIALFWGRGIINWYLSLVGA